MIESIENHQPHIVVNLGDSVHVVSVALIRDIANDRAECDKEKAQCIATALLDMIND